MHRSEQDTPDVLALLDPYSDLALAVSRRLAQNGFRLVALGSDPVRGREFSTRMVLEGFTIPHRLIGPEVNASEVRAAEDIVQVYGGLRGMVSFLGATRSPRSWLQLPVRAAEQLMARETSRRLRMLRAVAPLLRGHGFLQNVTAASRNGDGVSSFAAAGLWDHVLGDEWDREGVIVRRTVASMLEPGHTDVEVNRVMDDFDRLIALTGGHPRDA